MGALNAIKDDGPWALVVLSPGPGCPADFDVSGALDACSASRTPVFGVCLGLQGIVEHFGGTLGQLAVPVHGKPASVALKAASTCLMSSRSWRPQNRVAKGAWSWASSTSHYR